MKSIFENPEFDALYKKVLNSINDYLEENSIELPDELEIENIIMWQRTENGNYFVHPTEKCPNIIKGKVLEIIERYNPTL